jgi:hypothetical protein
VVTAELGRGRGRLYDPAVTDGRILVGVENPPAGKIDDLQRVLGAPPGAEVKTV